MFYQNRPTSHLAAWPAVTKRGQQSCAKIAPNGMGKRESWTVRCTSALLPYEMHPTARYKTTTNVYTLHIQLRITKQLFFVFSITILPLAQNKNQLHHFKWFFVIKTVFNALFFPPQNYNCDKNDRLPEPNKVKTIATLLQNIGFSQNIWRHIRIQWHITPIKHGYICRSLRGVQGALQPQIRPEIRAHIESLRQ
jgi:hypothetical protein